MGMVPLPMAMHAYKAHRCDDHKKEYIPCIFEDAMTSMVWVISTKYIYYNIPWKSTTIIIYIGVL